MATKMQNIEQANIPDKDKSRYLTGDQTKDLMDRLFKISADLDTSTKKYYETRNAARYEKKAAVEKERAQKIRIERLYENLKKDGLPLPDFPIKGLTEKQIRDKIVHQLIQKRAESIHRIRRRKNQINTFRFLFSLLPALLVISMLCTAPFFTFPYIYYQYLRWAVTAWFAFTLFSKWDNIAVPFKVLFIVTAVTFNPFEPIQFSKEVWKIIDLCAAALILLNGVWSKKKSKAKSILASILIIASAGGAIYAAKPDFSPPPQYKQTSTTQPGGPLARKARSAKAQKALPRKAVPGRR